MKINGQFENDFDFINSENDRKIILQSLYKDICNNDNYVKYLIEKLVLIFIIYYKLS